MLHKGPPKSNEGYSYAKRLLDVHCNYITINTGTILCIIPTNLYGKYDNYSLSDVTSIGSQVLFGV